ncbi:MAG: glycosyltransferase [Planctomycetes bacterium]|nr:glycosyltransferase [Planctomycetota bacterium]
MAHRVSAVIPCYQMAGFVARAVRSVLAQEGDAVEVVVCDDGSRDDPASALREFGDRVKVVRQENRGLPAARNTGSRASTGEFIAYLDADDQWLPHKSRVQVAALDADPDAGWSYGRALAVGDEDPTWRLVIGRPPVNAAAARRLTAQILREGNVVPVLTGLVRRTAYDALGGFDETLRRGGEDYDFWLRISARYGAAYIDDPIALYRLHEAGFFVSDFPGWHVGIERVHARVEREHADDPEVLDALDFARNRVSVGLGKHLLHTGDRVGARAAFTKAVSRLETRDEAIALRRWTYVPTPLVEGARAVKRRVAAALGS